MNELTAMNTPAILVSRKPKRWEVLKPRIVELREQGRTYDEIARELHTDKANVVRALSSVTDKEYVENSRRRILESKLRVAEDEIKPGMGAAPALKLLEGVGVLKNRVDVDVQHTIPEAELERAREIARSLRFADEEPMALPERTDGAPDPQGF
jgi:DNA-binding CsgD family transcriptional regulator